MLKRILYIESKDNTMNGPARIGRVTFTPSGKGFHYQGREFARVEGGAKENYIEVATNIPYWIATPKRDGMDRLLDPTSRPVEIDADVREEYWRDIRRRPEWAARPTTWPAAP